MTLHLGTIRGAQNDGGHHGQIDYRLARRSVIRGFHNGRLSRLDICDAHPELMRAARHVGEATSEDCPICEESKVVLVTYAFGPGLGAAGHCITSKVELSKIARRTEELTCYVVEVCPGCSWNHLARSFHVPGRRRGRRA